jgi:hypothetical protein
MKRDLGQYKYSILRYRHSTFLGEVLNIGYIVYFEEEKKIFFHETNNLRRISTLYSDFSYNLIKYYIKDIHEVVNRINSNSKSLFDFNINDNFNVFLNENIFPIDGSSLIFSQEVLCQRHSLSQNNVFNYLSKFYVFNKKPIVKREKIKDLFYNNVKAFVREDKYFKNPNFYSNYKIENGTGTEFNFDFAWQNGNLNLVRTLDLNFSTPKAISRKSYENFGLLYDLKETASDKDYNFDFLVSEPKEKSLHREYNHSIKLISNLPYANVIEEREFEKYVEKVKDHIS